MGLGKNSKNAVFMIEFGEDSDEPGIEEYRFIIAEKPDMTKAYAVLERKERRDLSKRKIKSTILFDENSPLPKRGKTLTVEEYIGEMTEYKQKVEEMAKREIEYIDGILQKVPMNKRQEQTD